MFSIKPKGDCFFIIDIIDSKTSILNYSTLDIEAVKVTTSNICEIFPKNSCSPGRFNKYIVYFSLFIVI